MNASELYAAGRERVIALVTSVPADQLDQVVPATPEWTGKDLLAHLVGEATDLMAGSFPAPGNEWQNGQVAARKDRSVDELIEEWRGGAAAFDDMLKSAPEMLAGAMPADIVHHELDLRAMLGTPAPDELFGEPMEFGLAFMAGWLDKRLRKKEMPGLRVRTGEQEWELGDGPVAATLTTTKFEFFRILAGRRSERQVAALDWDGDPTPYLSVLSAFGPLSSTDVLEDGLAP